MSVLLERITLLTDQCRMSITEMCKKAGVTRSILSEYSKGRTKELSTPTLKKICSLYCVSADFLTGMADSDTARCPVCGFSFPVPDRQAAVEHESYHDRFERLRARFEFIYPEYECERMVSAGSEEATKGKFSLSVLSHGEDHPGYSDYIDWLAESDSGYLYLPDRAAPRPLYRRENDGMGQLPLSKIRLVPLYESASAGFGAQASGCVIDQIPLFISSDAECDDTMCIKVVGNSMYPKIEDGDIVQVVKTPSVDSGRIAVVLLDGDQGLIKRVVYGDDWVELQSINPEYAPRRFEGADLQRIRVVGLVKRIIKDC